ncbi:MAG: TRAP transporter substrate-binding protein [Actinomycetota bacterium]|nr:TRAP transporter substrate-binding protein [Actinomycetota bacterium]
MGNPRRRRAIVFISVLGLVLAACGGQDAAETDAGGEGMGPEVTLTLGHPFPASHPIQVAALEPFIEAVAEVTNGTVTIEIVPAGGLGPAPGTYENVVAGAQDLGWALQGYTPGRFPVTDLIEMPYTFTSATDATDALWDLYEEFPEFQEEYRDVHVLGLWTHDVGNLWTAGSQVTTIDDVPGLTLRAPGPVQNQLITELGGSPVGLPAPELHDSLERGVIDGLMIANSGLESFGLFDVLDYGIECLCYVAAQFLTINQGVWDSLSPEQQAAIDEIGGRTLSLQAAEAYDEEYQLVADKLAEEGIELTVLEGDELEQFEAAGDAVVQAWIAAREDEGVPGQAMYDRLTELAD